MIDSKFYLYEITEYFTSQFETVMNSIGNSSRDSILDDIIFYIDHNYQTNIKLETIAPLFGYNSAYLGKIFSKTVGENFNNYVDSIRIKHAKQLIIENKLKVYEISEAVGYKNVDYFHKKFKKYVGQSPAEYRKLAELSIGVKGQRVLDIGTGTGVIPRNMYGYGAEWTGIDISENQIMQAVKLSAESGMNIEYRVSSAEDIDFPAETFDAVTACQCFMYFDRSVLIPKIHRILKPGGHFCILFMAWLPDESPIAAGSEELVLN